MNEEQLTNFIINIMNNCLIVYDRNSKDTIRLDYNINMIRKCKINNINKIKQENIKDTKNCITLFKININKNTVLCQQTNIFDKFVLNYKNNYRDCQIFIDEILNNNRQNIIPLKLTNKKEKIYSTCWYDYNYKKII